MGESEKRRALVPRLWLLMKLSLLSLLALLATGCPAPVLFSQRFAPANYTRIDEGLYVGGSVDRPPPGTRAVLNLTTTRDPYRCEVRVWEAIPDAGPAPDLDWLAERVLFIAEQRRAGRTTYVHCSAGRSRSAFVTAAYLMYRYDWSRDRALAYLRSQRPITRPNPAFVDRLLDWERELNRRARNR